MPGSLDVLLGELRVGSLVNLPGDYNVFSFDEEFAADPDRPILSRSFLEPDGRLRERPPQYRRVAPPYFANLLPEAGSPLRTLVSAQYGVNKTRDFPYLAILGEDLPGNVIMRPPLGTAFAEVEVTESSSGTLETGAELRVATPSAVPKVRFSLAGVQMKFSASFRQNRLMIPASGRGGSWIVKLPSPAFPHLPDNEHAMLELARQIGLTVPQVHLIELASIEHLSDEFLELGGKALAVERYDRTANGGRMHCEDFNQIAGQPPEEKYDNHTMDWVGFQIASLCPLADVEEFVRRVVFMLAIGNGDMHLKNWSLLYPDGRHARLAPVYDYVCTRRYMTSREMALSLGGEKEWSRVSDDTFAKFLDRAKISRALGLRIARETVERTHDAWRNAREKLNGGGALTDPDLVRAVDRQFTIVPLLRDYLDAM